MNSITLARIGTLLDPANRVPADKWYRVGNRVAWWDRYSRHWIVYYVEPGTPYQRGACDMYPNAESLIECEADIPTEWQDD